jgi:hypothetical protein
MTPAPQDHLLRPCRKLERHNLTLIGATGDGNREQHSVSIWKSFGEDVTDFPLLTVRSCQDSRVATICRDTLQPVRAVRGEHDGVIRQPRSAARPSAVEASDRNGRSACNGDLLQKGGSIRKTHPLPIARDEGAARRAGREHNRFELVERSTDISSSSSDF